MFLITASADWPTWVAGIIIAVDLVIRFVALGWIPYRRKPTTALGWLMAIFLIPYVGILAFLIFGSTKLPRSRREKQSRINDYIREGTEEKAILGRSEHLPLPLATSAQLNYSLGALPMTHGNEFSLQEDNHQCYLDMAAEVDRATTYVHFEFYIVAMDETTAPLLESLFAAHARGVKVRILIDHLGSAGYPGYSELVKQLDASGISWRRCLPIRPWRLEYQRPDLRNHRKILVVDGEVAYTGSLNVIDRSYNKKSNVRKGFQWKDLAVRCTGPVVAELNAVFASDWYAETGDILADEYEETIESSHDSGVMAQVVPSGPGFELENNLMLFNHLIYNANHSVVICSPYFVPDESLMKAMVTESRSGVDVRLYVGATSNNAITQKAQQSYYDDLVDAGVRIFEYHAPTVLHSKFVLIDDEVTIIGSSNMDERSFALNMEVSLFIVDKEFTARMYQLELDDYRENSVELDVAAWRERSIGRKYVESLARLTSSLQ
nr:cardiolipin synthase [Brevibacterium daeguense]